MSNTLLPPHRENTMKFLMLIPQIKVHNPAHLHQVITSYHSLNNLLQQHRFNTLLLLLFLLLFHSYWRLQYNREISKLCK